MSKFQSQGGPKSKKAKEIIYPEITKETSISEMKLIKEKSDYATPISLICATSDGRIAMCANTNDIPIINPITLEIELTLTGHKEKVVDLSLLDNGWLLSSAEDYTIKKWNVQQTSFQCVETIDVPTLVSMCIPLSNNRLCAFTPISTIKIFLRIPPYQEIISLSDNKNITSLFELKNKKYFVSCSVFDNLAIFWSGVTYKKQKVFKEIMCLKKGGVIEVKDRVIIGEYGGAISIINSSTLQLERKIQLGEEVSCIFSSLDLNNGSILLGDKMGRIVQFSLDDESDIIIREEHNNSIFGLVLAKDNSLISCSYHKTFKKWELS